jgi:hypothetical protein
MKKAISTAIAMLALLGGGTAHAVEPPLNVLLAGGAEANRIGIAVSPDGRTYVIDSVDPLDIGGEVCWHPEGQETELECEAARIGGFEVNAGGGDDLVSVHPKVRVPTTLRGGPGDDRLSGAGGNDKLIGGSGNDILDGRGGDDALFGGADEDQLFGGSGDDQLVGGTGVDRLHGQGGKNVLTDS